MKVSVSAKRLGTALEIAVQDDGVGFDFLKAVSTTKTQRAFGLFSIQERMSDLGGSFKVESEAGKGSRAALTVALEMDL